MQNETLKTLRKLEVDCLYTKGKHFNAAERLQKESKWFRLGLILGSCFTAFASFMNIGIWSKIPGDTLWLQMITNVLGAIGALFVLYTTTFASYYAKMEESIKHDRIGVDVNLISKLIRNTEAAYKDRILDDSSLHKALHDFTTQYHEIIKNAPITTEADYKKTKANFNDGNTEYTEKELNS